MTIRRIDKGGKSVVQPTVTGTSRAIGSVPEEIFARQLAAQQQVEAAEIQEPEAVMRVRGVPFDPGGSSSEGARYRRREQLEKTDELLGTLAALGRDLTQSIVGSGTAEEIQERLREARDHALRTLSDVPEKGEERELLHRTAVLATVELAKTDRGDYK